MSDRITKEKRAELRAKLHTSEPWDYRDVLSLLDELDAKEAELEEERDLRHMAERHAATMSGLSAGLPQALDVALGKLAKEDLCHVCCGTHTFIDSSGHYRLCEQSDCVAWMRLSDAARELRLQSDAKRNPYRKPSE